MNGDSAAGQPALGEPCRAPGEKPRQRLRAFVAVMTPPHLHMACNRLAEEGRELGLRWARPESVHLTLRFWGDLRTDAVAIVCEGLQRAATASGPFLAPVRGLGCFPNTERPRVLWMGLEDPELQLLQLRRRVDASLAAVGLPSQEKPFRPHLTVARVRRVPEQRELKSFLRAHANQPFGSVAVSHLHLMRSDLSGKGAVHTRLHSLALRGGSFAEQPPLGGLKEEG